MNKHQIAKHIIEQSKQSKTRNYILHFKGRTTGAIGKFYGYRFEGDFESNSAFFDALYAEYEHIQVIEFYIDGEKSDFWEVSRNTSYTEAN